MPNYVSVDGKWFPAREVVQLPLNQEEIEAGKDPVYRGPDREALKELNELGVEHLGHDYRTDIDLLRLARAHNFNTVEEYVSVMGGISPEKNKEAQEKKIKEVVSHAPIRRRKGIKRIAGGSDTANNGNDMVGGFGDPVGVNSETARRL